MLKWVWDGGKKTQESTGQLQAGKTHGRWVIQWTDDDGNLSGNQMEGPYVEGKRQGLWTYRETDGTIEKRPFVDGKRHGQVTGRNAAGSTWEVAYVEGKKHGRDTASSRNGQQQGR